MKIHKKTDGWLLVHDDGSVEYATVSFRFKYWCAMILAHGSFWTGHVVSKLMDCCGPLAVLYPVYNNLMCRCCDLSNKYDLGIWRVPENTDVE